MANRYKERSEIEALFFATNTQLATLRQPSFIPPEGVSLYALQKAWDALEKAEHRREVALRNELLRLERLEQLAYKFERKVTFLSTPSRALFFLIFISLVISAGIVERWIPEGDDSSAVRSALRQQPDTSGSHGQETRGHLRRHSIQGKGEGRKYVVAT